MFAKEYAQKISKETVFDFYLNTVIFAHNKVIEMI